MFKKILVPLNGSAKAEKAIPYALELGRLANGRLLFTQIVPSPVSPPPRFSMAEPDAWLIRQAQLREEAEAYLREVIGRPELAAANPGYVIGIGLVGDTLLSIIEREKIDTVVMTTRRRRGVARWFLGSTADFLVQNAPVPVLLVRKKNS